MPAPRRVDMEKLGQVPDQELAQEAFVRALQRWGDLESDEHARNFVYKVAINLARSHMRKYARVRPYGLTGFGDRHVEVDAHAHGLDEVAVVIGRVELGDGLDGGGGRQGEFFAVRALDREVVSAAAAVSGFT